MLWKEKAMEVPAIKAIIEKMEGEMAGNGRIHVPQVVPNLSLASYGRGTYNRSQLLCRYSATVIEDESVLTKA